MKKGIKMALYCILAIILIIVIYLMLGISKDNAGEPDTTPEIFTWTEEIEIQNKFPQDQPTQNFEQDVMDDLESLFNNTNGYENIQWEFWFTSIDE